jgi:hypothetical protein
MEETMDSLVLPDGVHFGPEKLAELDQLFAACGKLRWLSVRTELILH